jgi:4-hydroxyphenylpyruvate dioxygenase
MKTSIATVCLSGNLAEKLTAIANAGFDGVEIFEMDFVAFDHTPREVGRMVRDSGLAVTLFQPFRDFEGMPDPLRAKAFDRAERKFDVMQDLGADLMLVCSSVSSQALGGIERAAADFHALGERAAKRGLRVGYEALAWGRYVNDHRDAWEIVRRADHQAVGLILDSFHTLARGIDVTSIQSIPPEKIFIVQLADAPKLDMDYLSWSRHFRSMPGQGDFPLVAFTQAVQATGYDGYLSLEIFNDQFRAGSASAVAIDGKRSLIYLVDQVAGRNTAPLPPRAVCKGIEFVEFAVDGADVAELESVIGALGFARRAAHKSKDVALWRQNDINIVVNSEGEGFAHASYVAHGPSVCAFCLRVEDAQAATRRAQSLLARPFRQPVAAGELEIPAVRGVGGSLIYLIDGKSRLGDLWDVDFVPLEAGTAAEQGELFAIDHLSQSMGYDEMLSWLLFYTSIFDLNKTPEVDIADPGGLVRSQVVRATDGGLRIVLNGSQSQRTQSARFLSEFFGSGVQHIAFATSDIFATTARLRAAGLETLPIPANYYDDLGGRFDLEPALLERMEAFGILYDSDAAGEYFQIYTRTVAGRFFFEIVERRGYSGFGAPNAAIRLAAQARAAEKNNVSTEES